MKGCDRKRMFFHGTPTDIPYIGLLQKHSFSTENLKISFCSQGPRSAAKMRPLQKIAHGRLSRTSAVGRSYRSVGRVHTNPGNAADAEAASAARASKKTPSPLLRSAGGAQMRVCVFGFIKTIRMSHRDAAVCRVCAVCRAGSRAGQGGAGGTAT